MTWSIGEKQSAITALCDRRSVIKGCAHRRPSTVGSPRDTVVNCHTGRQVTDWAFAVAQTIGDSQTARQLSQPGKLTPPPSTARNWKQRALDNGKLLGSGSAADLVQIVESLTDLHETKTLAPHERQTLERAKKLLVCEISEVLGETRSAVEELIGRALQARKTG